MKLSELKEIVDKILAEYGDLEVATWDDEAQGYFATDLAGLMIADEDAYGDKDLGEEFFGIH
jgi:hypothetical protein